MNPCPVPGLHRALSAPAVYSLFTRLVGGPRSRETFVRTYVRARPGDRILDVGCGPGSLLAFLPECQYVGLDNNPRYIAAATHRFGARGTFLCRDVRRGALRNATFDIVIAAGVVHHMDDGQAAELFGLASSVLRPEGRLVTLDGCYSPTQPRLARWLLSRDRGRYVRDQAGYVALARETFRRIEVTVRDDLLRPIPYTHIILECTREAAGEER